MLKDFGRWRQLHILKIQLSFPIKQIQQRGQEKCNEYLQQTKIDVESLNSQISQSIPEQKEQRVILPALKTYYKGVVTTAAWHCHKN
jgi:hypothetical protein